MYTYTYFTFSDDERPVSRHDRLLLELDRYYADEKDTAQRAVDLAKEQVRCVSCEGYLPCSRTYLLNH
jgi:hypothetical protein